MTAMKKGLGKGLSALLTDTGVGESSEESGLRVLDLDILKVEPNRDQPRKSFKQEELNELSESIKEFGIIQPIIVKEEEGYFSIIAGERRWRAARLAGLTTIPAIVREYSEIQTLEAALIENVQRADLNPMEEAYCYLRLMQEYNFTQEKLSERIGKNRSYISNLLRICKLNDRVKEFIFEERLSVGHARALLPINDENIQIEISERIIENNLSVRETEEIVRKLFEEEDPKVKENKKRSNKAVPKAPEIKAVENDLQTVLGAKVLISSKEGKEAGKIEIEFFNKDDLDRILVLLKSCQ